MKAKIKYLITLDQFQTTVLQLGQKITVQQVKHTWDQLQLPPPIKVTCQVNPIKLLWHLKVNFYYYGLLHTLENYFVKEDYFVHPPTFSTTQQPFVQHWRLRTPLRNYTIHTWTDLQPFSVRQQYQVTVQHRPDIHTLDKYTIFGESYLNGATYLQLHLNGRPLYLDDHAQLPATVLQQLQAGRQHLQAPTAYTAMDRKTKPKHQPKY